MTIEDAIYDFGIINLTQNGSASKFRKKTGDNNDRFHLQYTLKLLRVNKISWRKTLVGAAINAHFVVVVDEDEELVEYPIDGILDLHHFAPKDVKELVPEYIEECLKRGITQIRIIHGKGTGTLRRTVHSLLDKNEHVLSYRLDSQSYSSWGATLVELRPSDADAK